MNWTQTYHGEKSWTFPLSSSEKLEEISNLLEMTLFLYRILLPLLVLLTAMIGMDSRVIESVVFHPMNQIHNGISSWILTHCH